jgi:acetyl-CoA C-acetyltransferase
MFLEVKMREVYLVSGVRTAIGTFGGALKDVAPTDLATKVTAEALARSHVPAADIGHVVFGQVIHTESKDMYISRVAMINAGIPVETPALTVNRLCGSGLQAIVSASQSILLGDCETAIGGGAESMSRAPYHTPAMRWGARMGDATMTDILLGTLHDPFHKFHMGITAENLAEKYEITREQQDAFALESHRRASAAIKAGYFRDQIVGYELKTRKGTTVFAEDEHVRHDAKLEDMSNLRPAFKKEGGTVTAGNASGINDGAAAVVLASGEAVKKYGLTPMARLVSYAHAGVDPAFMGIGPVPATQTALAKAGLSVGDMGVIESNEAFAAQACTVSKVLGFDPAKVNPNGSGISLGHPVGATGAINTVKIVHEMQRVQARYGLVTMCIGGGQGIATIWERV